MTNEKKRAGDQLLHDAMLELGFPDFAERAAGGEWNDYFGIHAMPQHHLVHTLHERGEDFPSKREAIKDLMNRVKNGDFDSGKDDADAWAASPEGQEIFQELLGKKKPEAEPTDAELRRMVRMDPGDSYIMHLPDGTQEMTGYTAEGGRDESEYAARLRTIYNNWKKRTN